MAGRGAVKFEPGHQLQKKVPVSGSGTEIDPAAIERAEKALDDLSSNFDEWTDADVTRLVAAREAARENGCTGEFADELFRVVHDLKGHAVTFRYPLVTLISASLCRLLETTVESVSVPDELIDIHINAIRAIVRDRVHGESDPTALTVVNQLIAATDAFIEAQPS